MTKDEITEAQVLQGCVERADATVKYRNTPETRMMLAALIEKQIRMEKDAKNFVCESVVTRIPVNDSECGPEYELAVDHHTGNELLEDYEGKRIRVTIEILEEV